MCRSRLHGIALFTFLQTCNIFCDSSLQCPARWTNIQAVVSPGPNPLPAEVHIKRSAAFGDNFYYKDQKQWEIKPFALKTYADPIQEMVQKMIGRCFIFSFALFKYQEDIDVKNFVPKLPLPHDACIHKLLEIVKAEQGRCIVEVDSDDALDDADKKNVTSLE